MSTCYCCSLNVIIDVAPEPLSQITRNHQRLQWLCRRNVHWGSYTLWNIILYCSLCIRSYIILNSMTFFSVFSRCPVQFSIKTTWLGLGKHGLSEIELFSHDITLEKHDQSVSVMVLEQNELPCSRNSTHIELLGPALSSFFFFFFLH